MFTKALLVLALCIVVSASDRVVKPSAVSVDQTVERLKAIIHAKGMTLFTVVDHQKNAEGVGMKLGEAKLVIFGNPKMGTKLMQGNIQAGLDLPIRILVYSDVNAKTQIAYRKGDFLSKAHGLKMPDLISKMNNALDAITTKAGASNAALQ